MDAFNLQARIDLLGTNLAGDGIFQWTIQMSSLVQRNRFSSARVRYFDESYLTMSDEKWSIQ